MTTTQTTSSTFRRSFVDPALFMSVHKQISRADGSTIELAFTERSDGDFHIDADPDALAERRKLVMAGPWAVVRQVHGADVADAALFDEIGFDPTNAPHADAIVTSEADQPIAVQGADCAPLAFITSSGPIAVAHAGWRGLAAGVIESVTETLAERGAVVEEVLVGPVIGTACYEFGSADLDDVAAQLGPHVRGVSATGTPALDMRAAIESACNKAGIDSVSFVSACTSCGDSGFSHRARGETERHALVARIASSA